MFRIGFGQDAHPFTDNVTKNLVLGASSLKTIGDLRETLTGM
jgi:2C-methyl-D-erythritol 2,4-cyclodiphosphate synthase